MSVDGFTKNIVDTLLPELGVALRDRRMRHRLSHDIGTSPFGFRFAGHRAMLEGDFEAEETTVIREKLRTADRFIDVGANIGYYDCVARSMGKPCLAFEPVPQNLRGLYANLKLNGWLDTEVLPVGLSDNMGMAEIFGVDTGASLIRGWAQQKNPIGTPIALTTMDAVIGERFAGERLLIKVDVEGHELAVFMGAKSVLSRTPRPVIVFETSLDLHHPEPNKNYSATFELLWDLGYSISSIEDTPRLLSRELLAEWVESGHCGWKIHNWLAE